MLRSSNEELLGKGRKDSRSNSNARCSRPAKWRMRPGHVWRKKARVGPRHRPLRRLTTGQIYVEKSRLCSWKLQNLLDLKLIAGRAVEYKPKSQSHFDRLPRNQMENGNRSNQTDSISWQNFCRSMFPPDT